jgi:ribosomal protein S27E
VTEGKCPSCGAPVAFTAGSAQILVCESCRTVIARKGPALEARGKIAAIVDTDSPLRLGIQGRHGGRGFRVVGHLQKDYGQGPWDEWFLELDDGSTAWLSESEGAWHLMTLSESKLEIDWAQLRPGATIAIEGKSWVVEEVGTARTVAAEGQLPADLNPNLEDRYVDATGPGGSFVTLDFGQRAGEAETFVGAAVAFEKLGISPDQLRPKSHKAELLQARCTQCNGPLELHAPDQSKRVACPYCGALLDVSRGRLSFLQALEGPKYPPKISLGRKGALHGAEWLCIAFLVRSCRVEGVDYRWEEYLLFNRSRGFSWLVESEGHWTHLLPIPAGDVQSRAGSVVFGGRRFRAFQAVKAVTDYVLGECYWAVQQGESAAVVEYVDPPRSLTREESDREISYSAGTYVDPKDIAAAFHLEKIGAPRGIAPSQPNPAHAKLERDLRLAFIYSGALLALYLLVQVFSSRQKVLDDSAEIPRGTRPGSPEASHVSQPFEIQRSGNLEATLTGGPLENEWLGLDCALFNEVTGEVTSFYSELSYYHGVDSDGRWSEGSPSQTVYLSRVPAGRYTLQGTPYFAGLGRFRYSVALRSGVPRVLWFFVALAAIFVWPLITKIRAAAFEKARWNESNLAAAAASVAANESED